MGIIKNRKLIFAAIALGVLAVTTTVFLTAALQGNGTVELPSAVKTVQTGYVVRLEGNSVNIYTLSAEGETYSGSAENVNVYDLPETVRENLKNGMSAENKTELEGIIENLSS